MDVKASKTTREDCQAQLEEGKGHIKFGVGVGLVSAVSLAAIGTTCPLCFFVAPAMVAAGVHKRRKAQQDLDALGPEDILRAGDCGEDGSLA